MTKSPSLTTVLLLAVAALLVLAAAAPRASAVTCSADQLKPCMPAFEGTPAPSSDCCSKLNEQKPCICEYMKDPNLKKYWGSPKAKKICKACHVPFPPKCK